jgi:hypothetical protein
MRGKIRWSRSKLKKKVEGKKEKKKRDEEKI